MSRAITKETFLKTVLRRYLLNQFPDLTSQELEFILGVAFEDLVNFVAFKEGYIYEEHYKEKAIEQLSELAERDPIKFDKVVSEHTEVWGVKWSQRVKLVLGNDTQDVGNNQSVEKKVGELLPLVKDIYNWLHRVAVGSLISNGEVCFTNLIADTIVKEVFFKLAASMAPQEAASFAERNPVFLMSEVIRKARGTAQYKGNLVVVRVNPSFFSENRGEVIEW